MLRDSPGCALKAARQAASRAASPSAGDAATCGVTWLANSLDEGESGIETDGATDDEEGT